MQRTIDIHSPVVEAVADGRFVLSELGDGTAVLTSLSDSRIISLNALGTEVVRALLASSEDTPEARCEALAGTLAARHGVAEDTVRTDIERFLSGLSARLEDGAR